MTPLDVLELGLAAVVACVVIIAMDRNNRI